MIPSDAAAQAGWDARRWVDALADYYEEYSDIAIGPPAQHQTMLQIEKYADHWQVRQVLDDPEGDRDWAINARVDLPASDEEGPQSWR